MPLTTRKRPRIGDVIEIPTPKGFAYAHYTHKHDEPPRYGALLRILPGIFPERPGDFAALVLQPPIFSTFFPLGAACHRDIVSVVASEDVPAHTRDFPTFRGCNWHRDREGKLHVSACHWLWDGQREWRVESLSRQQLRDYPPRGIPNDTMLIERIISGWKHQDEPPDA
jgi:hypothetical protein